MKDKKKDKLESFVEYVVKNKKSLRKKIIEADEKTLLAYRNKLAENGFECTPDEIKEYRDLIQWILDKCD
jgi:hypothetical protein